MYGVTQDSIDLVNDVLDAVNMGVSLEKVIAPESTEDMLAQAQNMRIAELMGQAEGLNGRITQLLGQQSDWEARVETLQARLERAITAHTKDIELIGETLIEKADDHGWCSEYDDVVERLNSHLNVPLEERVHDYTVEFRVTISLTARSADAAEDQAREAMQSASNRCDKSMDWDHTGTEQD